MFIIQKNECHPLAGNRCGDPFTPILVGIVMGLGAILRVKNVVDAMRENLMKKALTQLVGGKKSGNKLPEISLTR
jgi:hypothetical protein